MTLYIPEWFILFPLVWVGMGLLLWPVFMVRIHRSMKHNKGWTWRTTLVGRGFHPFRVLFGHVVAVLAWPWAMKEVS